MAGRHTQKHPHGVHMADGANSSAQEAQPPQQYADRKADERGAKAGFDAGQHDRQPWHPWEKDDYKGVDMTCNHDCRQGRECDCGDSDFEANLNLIIFVVAWVFVASCIGYAWGGWR